MNTIVNELIQPIWQVAWSIDIAQYFFMTGTSIGAYLIFVLAYGFNIKKFTPIAGLGLIIALTLDITAPLNLISDLGENGRFYELFYRTHVSSPMSWGGFFLTSFILYMIYMLLLTFRKTFAEKAVSSKGYIKTFYRLLAFGHLEISDDQNKKNRQLLRILALIGIPWILAVHGYTGFLLGVDKARPLWHTALMPVLFLTSGMISGMGLMIVISALTQRIETLTQKVNYSLMEIMAKIMAWSIVTDVTLKFIWYIILWFNGTAMYKPVIQEVFVNSFFNTFIIELLLGMVFPFVVAIVPKLRRIPWLLYLSSVFAIIGVWVFRLDTVIGGQQIPKIGVGFYDYSIPFWGKDGIIQVIGNVAFWILIYILAIWIIPWQRESKEADRFLNNI